MENRQFEDIKYHPNITNVQFLYDNITAEVFDEGDVHINKTVLIYPKQSVLLTSKLKQNEAVNTDLNHAFENTKSPEWKLCSYRQTKNVSLLIWVGRI